MESKNVNKIIETLKQRPAFVLIFSVVLACTTVIAVRTQTLKSEVMFLAVVVILALIILALLYFLHIDQKITLQSKIEDKNQKELMVSLENIVTDLNKVISNLANQVNMTNMTLELTHFGTFKFGKDKFHEIWKKMIKETDVSFKALSRMNPQSWDDGSDFSLNLMQLLRGVMCTGASVCRLFVIDSEGELQFLSKYIDNHFLNHIDVRYILLSKIKSMGFEYDGTYALNVTDDKKVALYHLDKKRSIGDIEIIVDSGRVKGHVELYDRIFRVSTKITELIDKSGMEYCAIKSIESKTIFETVNP